MQPEVRDVSYTDLTVLSTFSKMLVICQNYQKRLKIIHHFGNPFNLSA